jgi:predicted RNA binding protein YcfA (HicA-like mRNA interferase family)
MPRLTPVHYRKLIVVFQEAGYFIDRQESSHIMMKKPGALRPLVIPKYEEVEVFIIKGLLRSTKMSRTEFFRLLKG